MLYACDGKWWEKRNGAPDFKGLKLTNDVPTCTKYVDVHKVEVEDGKHFLTDKPGLVASGTEAGGHSGFQALNLAVQFGAKRIVLVGFDMRIDLGIHWHGPHGGKLSNPKERNIMKWRRALDATADQLRRLGVEVMNASAVSTLTAFPLVRLEDVLDDRDCSARSDPHLCRMLA